MAAEAAPASPGAANMDAYYLAPHWLLLDQPPLLVVQDLFSRAQVELEGTTRQALLHNERPNATLGALAAVDPRLAGLAEAAARFDVQPLSRAALLQGSRFDLLFVELTARCNETCVHCYAESSPRMGGTLPWEAAEQLLRDAHALGFSHVQFTGGDPLLYPQLVEAVRFTRALGIPRVEVYTNGLALHDPLYRELQACDVSFAMSFYSSDAGVHDAITRTPGSMARTEDAVRRVLAGGSPLRIGVIVMDENRDTLRETVRYLGEIGVPRDKIGISFQRRVGRGDLTEAQWDASLEPAAADEQPGERARAATHGETSIARFPGKAAVAADGTVYPCIFGRDFPLGSVHQRSLREILADTRPLRLESTEVMEPIHRLREQMSCWECAVRASLLAASAVTLTAGQR